MIDEVEVGGWVTHIHMPDVESSSASELDHDAQNTGQTTSNCNASKISQFSGSSFAGPQSPIHPPTPR
jgi:hypothetical protein